MENEAAYAGLLLNPRKIESTWEELLSTGKVKESLKHWWKIFEYLPVSWRHFEDNTKRQSHHIQQHQNSSPFDSEHRLSQISEKFIRLPHAGRGRVILEGQLIHASVAFKKSNEYTPGASLNKDFNFKWNELIREVVEEELVSDISWMENKKFEGVLEMDLFNGSLVNDSLVTELIRSFHQESDFAEQTKLLNRLAFMARSCNRADFMAKKLNFINDLTEPMIAPEIPDALRVDCAECLTSILRNVRNIHELPEFFDVMIQKTIPHLAQKVHDYEVPSDEDQPT
ncbi:hypothetical protein VKT23_012741, partial [Stygiomarasmius scandens]